MDDRYIDLARMLWNEMNPIEGYTNPVLSQRVSQLYGLNTPNYRVDLNYNPNIRPINELSYYHNMGKVPVNGSNPVDAINKGMYNERYTIPGEYVKYIKQPFDKIKNRIPNVTMGKIVNKILNEPVVKLTGKVANKSVVPLSILEGIGLNQPVY